MLSWTGLSKNTLKKNSDMKLDLKTKHRLMREAKEYTSMLANILDIRESATAVGNVIRNDQMAKGLIKLLLSFSCLDYIASKREGKLKVSDSGTYIEAAVAIAYQWKAAKHVIKKQEKTNEP